jgi:hypothetical protein
MFIVFMDTIGQPFLISKRPRGRDRGSISCTSCMGFSTSVDVQVKFISFTFNVIIAHLQAEAPRSMGD